MKAGAGRGVFPAGVGVSARGAAACEGSDVETERMKPNVVLKLPFHCPANFQSDTQAPRQNNPQTKELQEYQKRVDSFLQILMFKTPRF